MRYSRLSLLQRSHNETGVKTRCAHRWKHTFPELPRRIRIRFGPEPEHFEKGPEQGRGGTVADFLCQRAPFIVQWSTKGALRQWMYAGSDTESISESWPRAICNCVARAHTVLDTHIYIYIHNTLGRQWTKYKVHWRDTSCVTRRYVRAGIESCQAGERLKNKTDLAGWNLWEISFD